MALDDDIHIADKTLERLAELRREVTAPSDEDRHLLLLALANLALLRPGFDRACEELAHKFDPGGTMYATFKRFNADVVKPVFQWPTTTSQDTIEAYLQAQIRWSMETFGDSPRTLGLLEHLRKELTEVQAHPLDLEEWIDVIGLALDGFWRHGGSPQTLLTLMREKLNKNRKRKWIVTSPDKASEHAEEL